MVITSVRIGCAKTINLGNFQSLRIEADVTAELGEGEALEAVQRNLQVQLRSLLDETYRAQRKEHTLPGLGER